MGKKPSKSFRKADRDATGNVPSVFGARKRKEKLEKIERQALLPVIALFMASGLSSLIYQVIWTRMLVLIFGATTFATSTVLAIFMGGLALGSFLAGRVADRTKNPLIWYGILEGVIGAWALFAPLLFNAATPVYKWIWLNTHADLIPFSLLRFLATAIILIIPTTCMGATLPLLARFVTRNLDYVGRRVGALYAVNTFGAICGALLCGFILIPALGANATTWISAGINFGLLAIVIIYCRVTGQDSLMPAEAQAPDPAAQVSHKLPGRVILTMVAFGVSGAIAMIYEVCWTRALLMIIGSSTYAFTVMLTAFLAGIFIGSLVCARFIDKASQPYVWFAILQLSVGALTIVSMRLFNLIPYVNLVVNYGFHGEVNASMFARFLLAGVVLTPITICLGAIFPVVVKTCTLELSAVGRSVGSLYSANTIGAIIGAFLAGFVLIPLVGSEKTLVWSALINFWIGLIILWTSTRFKIGVALGSIVSIVVLAFTLHDPAIWDKNVLLTSQVERRNLLQHGLPETYAQWRQNIDSWQEVKFWKDGPCSNVGVVHGRGTKVTSLITNGHVDASDSADQPVQCLVSGFPLLLKPQAKQIAVIGWGSGQTVGTTLQFPVETVEAIELEPAVLEASQFFNHVNHQPEKDKRVHIQFNDGRNFLLATDQKFDVIVSEPSNPWQAGVCNLFTREYFAICKERLNPDGVLSVWMQTAEVPPEDLSAVLTALKQNFSCALGFLPRPGNLVLLASQQPIAISVPELKSAFANPTIKREFAGVSIPDYESFIGRLVITNDGLSNLVSPATNTDDRNKLEFDVGKTYESKTYVKENRQLLSAMGGDPWNIVQWGNVGKAEKASAMAKIARVAVECDDTTLGYSWAKLSNGQIENAEALELMGLVENQRNQPKIAQGLWMRALTLQPNRVRVWQMLGGAKVNQGHVNEGRTDLLKALSLEPGNKLTNFLLASSYTYDLVGRPLHDDELKALKPADQILMAGNYLKGLTDDEKFVEDHPNVLFIAAEINFKLRQFSQADKLLQRFLRYEPESDMGQRYQRIVGVYASGGTVEQMESAKLPAGK